ncbi:MAG: hypothetical protein A2015_00245 [Spirochaetes bacterium GWF1_31_7]|nr:MAG: hypothetical protein A2Y30_04265 [Spirochaetes bacterium GWE1_32_154]OHD45988.1 MAG: hypothetical protein A2Y29_07805 [Spirochaetes bacterium GWE2_31_10]OHD51019.1 MAG: hypothetical protein A2015_00245 [Spirochaetes bacterium GWF1_31_7]OHD83208.1 MAG: hypothetical protein A2355_02335 [Spirochaetes bacterium RIFOXYB1_FULL_32_8]HBD94335.1 hypothetical protein [Spirochaetia bacterium]
MKIWVKLLISIIIGGIAGVFFPEKMTNIKKFFDFASTISVSLLLYLTVPYVIVKMYTGIISMKNTKVKIWKITLVFIFTVMTSLVISIILSMFVMNVSMLQPDKGFELFQSTAIKLESYQISDLLRNMISRNPFSYLVSPLKFLLPIIFMAVVFAYGTITTGKKGGHFFDSIKSFGDILDTIVIQIVEIFSLLAVFIVASSISELKNTITAGSLFRPIVSIVVVIILLFILLSIMLKFIFKEDHFHYYTGLLGAGLTGFITGNTSATIIPLNLHLKNNINIDDDTTDYLVPIGVLLNQTGTVIVSTIVLMSIIISLAPSTLTLKLQVLIFLFVLLFSFRLDGVTELGFIVLLAMILKEPVFNFEDNSYLLFIGVAPLFSRVAIFINTITTGLYIMITGKYMGGQQKIEYRDFI